APWKEQLLPFLMALATGEHKPMAAFSAPGGLGYEAVAFVKNLWAGASPSRLKL
ncbi:hypothetical protein U9M48_005700, partial [Paspalum notatum var. saurae]